MSTELLSPVELYEQFYGPAIFQPLSKVLIELAAPQPGERVLDLACGTGLVARGVAPAVGAAGEVVAVDINPTMLAAGRERAAAEGATIEWLHGDAVALDLPAGTLDLALCQQGLQFFSDCAAALVRVRQALAEGGRLAVAVWQSIEEHPMFAGFAEVEARHLGPLGVDYDDLVAPFSLGSADELRALLEQAGFSRIEVVAHTVEADFPSPDTFARYMETAYGAVIPAFVEDRAAFERYVEAVEAETIELVRRFSVRNRVRFSMPAHLTLAYAD